MKREEANVSGRKCYLYRSAEAAPLLLQPIDEHDLEVLDEEVAAISKQSGKPFSLAAPLVEDWNRELTPWPAPPVFGKTPFGDGAADTLRFITGQLLPSLAAEGIHTAGTRLLLGGYSLAGLFALWAAYQTEVFDGIAAASPSVWFPRWTDYASASRPLASHIYLSLGDKEEKARNPVMAQVGNALRRQHEILTAQGIDCLLEWNPGNHFVDSDRRMAKGFAWLLNNRK